MTYEELVEQINEYSIMPDEVQSIRPFFDVKKALAEIKEGTADKGQINALEEAIKEIVKERQPKEEQESEKMNARSQKRKEPPAIVLYKEHYTIFESMTNDQAGALIKALCEYDEKATEQLFDDGMLKMAFAIMKKSIDDNKQKYYERCEKNREAINSRWNK